MSALAVAVVVEEDEPVLWQPRRCACPGCGKTVLKVHLAGDGPPVLVEVAEVDPRWPCPTCLSQRGRDPDLPCWRCGAWPWQIGYVGEDLEHGLGVAISAKGVARPYVASAGLRAAGEAVHKHHRCR